MIVYQVIYDSYTCLFESKYKILCILFIYLHRIQQDVFIVKVRKIKA